MLISPPFLPERTDDQSDADWLNTAMSSVSPGFIPGLGDDTIAGSYPVSMELGWHGGTHLLAPLGEDAATLPVRAIADGTVAYVRQPKAQNNNADEPLNYGAPEGGRCWTSDGVVLIRHETDIGASANGQAVSVVFYSLYMHLDSIGDGVRVNRRIYRKEELGSAGYIYGQPHRIHFEIFCDDENLQRLVGRQSGDLPLGEDGRNTVVFGELYFHLPTGTHLYAQQPAANQVTPTAGPVHTITVDLIAGLRYAEGDGVNGQRGDAMVTTYHVDGTVEGAPFVEHDAEYNLYTRAKAIAEAYPANARPAPSAVYELLRFGRVINTANETLTPADVPHWRQIRYPGGQGWVNLNATNVRKFSDADFPPWKAWQLIDDSADRDSCCDSPTIRRWFDTNQDEWVDIAEARNGLGDNVLLHKLEHTICKFPSEWRADTIDERWAWLMKPDDENFEALSADDFKSFKTHAQALCFWEKVPAQTPALPDNPWRFHPRRFVQVFRLCSYLSATELAQTFPRHMFYTATGNPRTAITTGDATYTLTRTQARSRIENYVIVLNVCIQKYIGCNRRRLSIFLAQVLLETAQWRNLGGSRRLMHEWGFGQYSSANPATQYYGAFYGRGTMQLTWAGNYREYGEYRHMPNHVGDYAERLSGVSPRITTTSNHHAAHPNNGGQAFLWSPRFDPDIVAEQPFAACDSGGFYWVSKSFSEGININRVADRNYSAANIGFVNRLVNGGGNGYYERQAYSAYMLRVLSDTVDNRQIIEISPPAPKSRVEANMTLSS